jgi:hypothetical protein
MRHRHTERAVADAAPRETARRAAGARGAGSEDPFVAELRRAGLPGIDLIRRELEV